jgi:hypothetical protein
MPMYNLPDVYSTTSTVPSSGNLQVVAAWSVWLSVNCQTLNIETNISEKLKTVAQELELTELQQQLKEER